MARTCGLSRRVTPPFLDERLVIKKNWVQLSVSIMKRKLVNNNQAQNTNDQIIEKDQETKEWETDLKNLVLCYL